MERHHPCGRMGTEKRKEIVDLISGGELCWIGVARALPIPRRLGFGPLTHSAGQGHR